MVHGSEEDPYELAPNLYECELQPVVDVHDYSPLWDSEDDPCQTSVKVKKGQIFLARSVLKDGIHAYSILHYILWSMLRWYHTINPTKSESSFFLKMFSTRNLLIIHMRGKYKKNWTKRLQVIDSQIYPTLTQIEKLKITYFLKENMV